MSASILLHHVGNTTVVFVLHMLEAGNLHFELPHIHAQQVYALLEIYKVAKIARLSFSFQLNRILYVYLSRFRIF